MLRAKTRCIDLILHASTHPVIGKQFNSIDKYLCVYILCWYFSQRKFDICNSCYSEYTYISAFVYIDLFELESGLFSFNHLKLNFTVCSLLGCYSNVMGAFSVYKHILLSAICMFLSHNRSMSVCGFWCFISFTFVFRKTYCCSIIFSCLKYLKKMISGILWLTLTKANN